jgi:hypothetical protein
MLSSTDQSRETVPTKITDTLPLDMVVAASSIGLFSTLFFLFFFFSYPIQTCDLAAQSEGSYES